MYVAMNKIPLNKVFEEIIKIRLEILTPKFHKINSSELYG